MVDFLPYDKQSSTTARVHVIGIPVWNRPLGRRRRREHTENESSIIVLSRHHMLH